MSRLDRNLRIRKLVPNNPRKEHTFGWHAWQLIVDGMTVQQYLDSPFDPGGYTYRKGRHVQPFTGPKLRHLKLDLDIGAIELYQHVEVASE
jgi:hypothetical protein